MFKKTAYIPGARIGGAPLESGLFADHWLQISRDFKIVGNWGKLDKARMLLKSDSCRQLAFIYMELCLISLVNRKFAGFHILLLFLCLRFKCDRFDS